MLGVSFSSIAVYLHGKCNLRPSLFCIAVDTLFHMLILMCITELNRRAILFICRSQLLFSLVSR